MDPPFNKTQKFNNQFSSCIFLHSINVLSHKFSTLLFFFCFDTQICFSFINFFIHFFISKSFHFYFISTFWLVIKYLCREIQFSRGKYKHKNKFKSLPYHHHHYLDFITQWINYFIKLPKENLLSYMQSLSRVNDRTKDRWRQRMEFKATNIQKNFQPFDHLLFCMSPHKGRKWKFLQTFHISHRQKVLHEKELKVQETSLLNT